MCGYDCVYSPIVVSNQKTRSNVAAGKRYSALHKHSIVAGYSHMKKLAYRDCTGLSIDWTDTDRQTDKEMYSLHDFAAAAPEANDSRRSTERRTLKLSMSVRDLSDSCSGMLHMCATAGSPRDTPKYELRHGMHVTERRTGAGCGYVSYGPCIVAGCG